MTGLFWLFGALLARSLVAQITCEALVERNVVEMGQTFTLTVRVSGRSLESMDKPRIETVEGLELAYPEPGTSTSIQIINGRRSESRSFEYLFRARKTGRWRIPPIQITIAGERYQTAQVIMEVVPAGSISGQNPADVSGDVQFAAIPSKREAFVGEQILVDFKIFTRVNVTQYSPLRTPNFIGFWVEEFPLKQPLEGVQETFQGGTFTAYTIKRVALFATRSGELVVDPAEIECELRIPRRQRKDPFESLFSPFSDPFGEVVREKFQSELVSLAILPLPEPNRPDGFANAVGQFDVRASVDRSTVRVGEAVTCRLEIAGAGNIRALTEPANPFPDAFEKYPVQTQDHTNKNAATVSGSRTFSWVAVPKSVGSFVIPPFEFVYFDPESRRFVVKTTDTLRLTCTPGHAVIAADAHITRQDIRPVRRVRSSRVTSVNDVTLVVVSILAPISAWALVLSRRRRERLRSDTVRYRSDRASPEAKKRLREAEDLLRRHDHVHFYAEIGFLLTQFLMDKLNLDRSDVRSDLIEQRLRERNAGESFIASYLECMRRCDMARFAPPGSAELFPERIHQDVRQLILEADRL